jgi:UDP-glucose 4-epimerase
VASRLAADPRIDRVIGLDPHDPPTALVGLLADVELIRADARMASGAIADLGAEAVVHLGRHQRTRPARRAAARP